MKDDGTLGFYAGEAGTPPAVIPPKGGIQAGRFARPPQPPGLGCMVWIPLFSGVTNEVGHPVLINLSQ